MQQILFNAMIALLMICVVLVKLLEVVCQKINCRTGRFEMDKIPLSGLAYRQLGHIGPHLIRDCVVLIRISATCVVKVSYATQPVEVKMITWLHVHVEQLTVHSTGKK